ncbi:BTE_HP_G0171700.mRNA.1.CDS.1 [Saccharomyces cerevisiae]|nr:BTE_HP_G0075090.mRNA.1.CDS.1 [Saccharomyces cerevisiae]CAI5212783.1 BTE_HP_G0171700.mRNA.1.CDS.1 [Saccharomyces cerevisiae]CAI6936529.1 BTE_HP_G0075090.mRNA.1.CDS.1 [Saccharomyces cerevisiae]CAI7016948.1 BTE_HP_G0171700.mRNA.1.CDS.1 [Saccharomyces cerevisiae]
MNLLETRRSLLEEMEIIENAIAERIQRNPELYYHYIQESSKVFPDTKLPRSSLIAENKIYKFKKVKRKRKQIILQQHEINIFLRDYQEKQQTFNKINRPEETQEDDKDLPNFERKLQQLEKELKNEDENFELDINSKKDKYALFSSSSDPSRRTNILSDRARDLDLNEIFTRDEQYGEYMELEQFHSLWLNVIKRGDCSLLQFLDILELFLDDEKYLLTPPMDRKNDRYMAFLLKLSKYVETFFFKSYALLDAAAVENLIKSDFEHSYCRGSLRSEAKGIYCPFCSRWFKTSSVFESHLVGKIHKKNESKRRNFVYSEYKLHRYLKYLKDEFSRTRSFVERKLAFTANERMAEMDILTQKYEAPAYDSTEKEGAEQVDGEQRDGQLQEEHLSGKSFDMPLGPDGLPMPYWLYKLHGLDREYRCEICSNKVYNGRRTFERHFNEERHLYHLRCLGIEPSSVFKGITKIKEAQELWKNMQGQSQLTSIAAVPSKPNPSQLKVPTELELEEEDEEGNVMSKKVYDELKKQGLV